jgi:prophage regulatory protein
MEINSTGPSDILLRVRQVMATCGKSRSAIYKDMKRGLFPRQVKITSRAAGWSRNEIEAWLEQRKRARDED